MNTIITLIVAFSGTNTYKKQEVYNMQPMYVVASTSQNNTSWEIAKKALLVFKKYSPKIKTNETDT